MKNPFADKPNKIGKIVQKILIAKSGNCHTLLGLLLAVIFALPLVIQAAPTNKEFVIGVSQEFETLNPMINTSAIGAYAHALYNRALNRLDADGVVRPQLAKSIPSLANKQAKIVGNKIEAVFEILDAAKWSDGKPVICQDFELSRKLAMSNNVMIAEKDRFTRVEKISWDEKNPKKCTFLFNSIRWDFYRMDQFYPLPNHIEGPVLEKFGNEPQGYEKNSNFTKNPSMPGLSNGPYMVSEFKTGSHLSLVVNPYFYGKPPKIQKITMKIITNTGILESNLRAGSIDAIGTLGITFDQAMAFEKKIKAENLPYKVHFQPGLTHEHIEVNLDNPILKDLKVRKALMYGMNREELVKALFESRQQVAKHFLSPVDKVWYTDDPKIVTDYKYDRKKAQQLLDEAGWKMDAKGLREKDGKPLSFSFGTTAGNKVRETVQVFLQNQWKPLGVELIIKNEPARVFFGETVRKRKFEALAMFAFVSAPEQSPESLFLIENIPTEKNSFAGQNSTGWRNAKVDESLLKMRVEMDAAKRKKTIHSVIKAFTEELPMLPLYFRSDIAVVPTNLKNYKLTGHQYYETNQAETWDLQ